MFKHIFRKKKNDKLYLYALKMNKISVYVTIAFKNATTGTFFIILLKCINILMILYGYDILCIY